MAQLCCGYCTTKPVWKTVGIPFSSKIISPLSWVVRIRGSTGFELEAVSIWGVAEEGCPLGAQGGASQRGDKNGGGNP
ncbi:hypothetical protein K370107A2_16150 [Merdimmobilis hominis]